MVIIYSFYSIQLRDNFLVEKLFSIIWNYDIYNLDNYIKNKGKIKINVIEKKIN